MPPNDPRFLDLTLEEMMIEYWAHIYKDKPDFSEAEDVDFDADRIAEAMKNGENWVEL